MDTREWFDESTYSDLTIKLSNGTEISVHKAMVCRGNAYFSKLCGPGSHFAESKQDTIELKDNDPDALTNILRHIYTLPVTIDPASCAVWRAWLNIRVTADKYLEPMLSSLADVNYRQAAAACTDSEDIFDILEIFWTEMSHDDSLVAFGEAIRTANLGKLLKNARYREHLDRGGKEAIWQQLDELIFATDLVKKKHYHLCKSHLETTFKGPTMDVEGSTKAECTICQHLVPQDNPSGRKTPWRCKECIAWLPK